MNSAFSSYTVIPNLAYTDQQVMRQQLDLYLPVSRVEEGRIPLLIMIHGGAWKTGDKGALSSGQFYLDHGWAVAKINYRFTSESGHPAQLEDCRAAIVFLKRHADEFGIDPDRFALLGHSAGGHLASLVGVTGDEAPGSRVAWVINQAGPTDFLNFWEDRGGRPTGQPEDEGSIEALLGGALKSRTALARIASPLYHLEKADSVPHLLIYGDADQVVPLAQGRRFYEAMTARGGQCEFEILPGAGHVDARFWQRANLERIVRFLET